MTDDLRHIDSDTTARRLPFAALIDALEAGFAAGCIVPTRHHHTLAGIQEPDATLLLMPAWSNPDDARQYLGVKLVTVFPGNTARNLPGLASMYVLYDRGTGIALALMDGNVITAYRTAATSALAARFLSRPESRKLLVIGAGRVASLIPDAYRAVRPIDQIRIWDIHAEAARKLADSLASRGMAASVADDLDSSVQWADIVSAATLAREPLIKGDSLRLGTHVDLIGGFTPSMREADDVAVRIASVYVDTEEALHEAGDLVQPIRANIINKGHVRATLEQLCRKNGKGRSSNDEITYFKAVGSGLADLVSARMVYETS